MILNSDYKKPCPIDGFIYRFEFPCILSNMYVIVDSDNHSAFIVDPNRNEVALQMLKDADVKTILIALTHEHFDHTSGIPWLQEQFRCTIVCHENALNVKSQKRNNRPVLAYMMREKQSEQDALKEYLCTFQPYLYYSEIVCRERLLYRWNKHEIVMEHTPGHSPASVLIRFDEKYVFTGDSLIPGIPVITRFPGGNQKAYETTTLPILKSIEKNKMILPGHGAPIAYCKLGYRNEIFEVILDGE